MRSIQVSTEVFAAIWKSQQKGEQSEDAILARLLGVRPTQANKRSIDIIGFSDLRYGVQFPEGFEIYRTYLGTDYRAKAAAGYWQLEGTGERFSSLNELSRAVGAKTENAWVNWFFTNADGERAPISNLRDGSKIVRRKRSAPPNLTLKDLGL